MRRLTLHLTIALLTFAIGVMSGAIWFAKWNPSTNQPPKLIESAPNRSPAQEEKEWPLTAELVSRALQTRIISTKRLRRNSDDEVVWRWFKESIAEYPQDFVELRFIDAEDYSVVIYRTKSLDAGELRYANQHLQERGLPLLQANKRYAKLQVNQGNIVCPSWHGYVDLDNAKLVYFRGHSA